MKSETRNTLRFWNVAPVLPPFSAVLGRLGYNPHKNDLDPEWVERIGTLIREALPDIVCAGVSAEFEIVRMDHEKITLPAGVEFVSSKLAAALEGCSSLTLMACTIGGGVKKKVEAAFQSGEPSLGVIYDAIGSEAVDALADRINETLVREKSFSRRSPSMRYSPGYGDWKIDVQPLILDLLQARRIGIESAPETHLLNPEKSITAVIGWK